MMSSEQETHAMSSGNDQEVAYWHSFRQNNEKRTSLDRRGMRRLDRTHYMTLKGVAWN